MMIAVDPRMAQQQARMAAQVEALLGPEPFADGMQLAAGPPGGRAGQDAYGNALQQTTIAAPAPLPSGPLGQDIMRGNQSPAALETQALRDAANREKLRQMLIKRGDIKR